MKGLGGRPENAVLVAVECESVNGMTYGEDFSAEITSSGIKAARFFCEKGGGYRRVENLPITAEQWRSIEEAALAIAEESEEIPPEKPAHKLSEPVELTDGPSRTRLYLTWRGENGGNARVCEGH